jgi:Holliday junction resolvase RusA-like endonuclease
MKQVEIILPFPTSVNRLYQWVWRKNKMQKTPQYRNWLKAADAQLMAQTFFSDKPRPVFIKPVEIDIYLTPADNRRRDDNNYAKAPIDYLVSREIIIDDAARYVKRTGTQWDDHGKKGTCRIVLRETKLTERIPTRLRDGYAIGAEPSPSLSVHNHMGVANEW